MPVYRNDYRPGGTDVALADGGTGASLSDPNADRIFFWDDSAGAVTWLTPGTNLTITGTTIDASSGSSSQVAFQTFTANVTISATTPATANTVVTAPAFTASAVPYLIEFACPVLTPGASGGLVPMLYLDGSAVGGVGGLTTSQTIGYVAFVHTPSAGSRTYSIRFYRTTSNGTVEAGDGTGTNYRPGFIRVSPA